MNSIVSKKTDLRDPYYRVFRNFRKMCKQLIVLSIRIEVVLQSCSLKKGVLRNFTKFTGKHLYQGIFFNKVAGNFIKKEALAHVFSSEFCEISKNIFLTKHLWRTASIRRNSKDYFINQSARNFGEKERSTSFSKFRDFKSFNYHIKMTAS